MAIIKIEPCDITTRNGKIAKITGIDITSINGDCFSGVIKGKGGDIKVMWNKSGTCRDRADGDNIDVVNNDENADTFREILETIEVLKGKKEL